MVYTLCAIPSDMKATLDDMGLDYAKLPDFDLFMLLTRANDAQGDRHLIRRA